MKQIVDCVVAAPVSEHTEEIVPTTEIMKCECGVEVYVEAISIKLINDGAKLYCIECFLKRLDELEKGEKDET
jgi:hypothetical protein